MAKDRVDRDDEDLVRLYLTDIGQYTLLTKDDEVRLAKAIEAGNEAIAELEPVLAELGITIPSSLGQALEELHVDVQSVVSKGYAPFTAAVRSFLGGTASAVAGIVADDEGVTVTAGEKAVPMRLTSVCA